MKNKNVYYRQCGLKKHNTYTTSWIPEKFAVEGKFVKFGKNGDFDDGWEVISVGQTRRSHKEAVERSQDYKKTA